MFRMLLGRLAPLAGAGMLLVGCAGAECLSGPLCEPDDSVVTGTVSGLVRVGTTGVPNVGVALSDGTAVQTGSNGGYQFKEVPVGEYRVTLSDIPSGVACDPTSRSVTLTKSDRQATANFPCSSTDGTATP